MPEQGNALSFDTYEVSSEAPAPAPQRPRWYKRRGPRAVAAGAAVVGVVAAGVVGVAVAVAGNVAPKVVLADAVENLKDDPASVTITSAQEEGEVTITRVGDDVQLSVQTPQDGTFEAVLKGETLYLRVTGAALGDIQSDQEVQGFLTLFPSLSSLSDGKWVSVDLSENSPVMSELSKLDGTSAGDQQAAQAAAQQLATSLQTIPDQLRGPIGDALTKNVTIAEVDDATGPQGSDHYKVTLDAETASDDAEPAIRQAANDLIAAVNTFVNAAGADALPAEATTELDRATSEAQADLDKFFAEDLDNVVADVWVQNRDFTQITVEDTTLKFDANPALDDVSGAVSLDDDLVRLLQFFSQMTGSDLDS